MNNTLTVELTGEQRDLLLRGLSFLRSDVLLEMRDPAPDVDADRETRLDEIESLVARLRGPKPAHARV
ncbi:MAG TPA: hypothetical protein VML55_20480 [Planctomycetaceae bacterium]|nr:hypothetical protein [Planctomycetaceae bacterium]